MPKKLSMDTWEPLEVSLAIGEESSIWAHQMLGTHQSPASTLCDVDALFEMSKVNDVYFDISEIQK